MSLEMLSTWLTGHTASSWQNPHPKSEASDVIGSVSYCYSALWTP